MNIVYDSSWAMFYISGNLKFDINNNIYFSVYDVVLGNTF